MSQPTGPYPQPQYAPPAPAKKSHTLRTVLIVVGIVAVLCCAGGIFGGIKLFTTVKDAVAPVTNVVNEFADDLESGNTTAAYTLLCSVTKTMFPLNAFEVLASDQGIQSHRITGAHVLTSNGRTTATVDAELTTAADGTESHTFMLVKESGEWKICGAPY
ncbi:Rv0361 family membrane protein [Hamadaea tsunoensis]|uniref:Rv0361 family membrane protein n=1 Tax=Hamadaea tsunoensis TaxID=53368 RepID=UPI0003FC4A2E|nr:DUF4878 domain-containing protein [Hamadaea tsunoensis]